MVTLQILETTREGRGHYIGRTLTITGGFTYRAFNYDDEIPTALEDADFYHATDGDTEYTIRDVRGWFRKQIAACYTGITDTVLGICTTRTDASIYIHKMEILGYEEDNAKGKRQNVKDPEAGKLKELVR